MMNAQMEQVPGFLFFDHVAVSVKPGELEDHVNAYRAMGFAEVHREDVLGTDQVREVLLQIGNGPNLIQLIEPLTPESPVAKQIEKNGGRGGLALTVDSCANTLPTATTLINVRTSRFMDWGP